ncbi:UvrABC system protein C, partial [Stenotrophomonas maltophilia]
AASCAPARPTRRCSSSSRCATRRTASPSPAIAAAARRRG